MRRLLVPGVLAVAVIVGVPTSPDRTARAASCPAPCFFPNIDVPLQWVRPGHTTKVTLVAKSNAPVDSVTFKVKFKYPSLTSLVRKGSSPFVIRNGWDIWTVRNVNGTKSVHFIVRIGQRVPIGKRLPFSVVTTAPSLQFPEGKPVIYRNEMVLHVTNRVF